ncbi:DNA phosphorothioation-dependent restriction protein DptH [Sulfurimonas sp. C5]|uniref:DNA phosphorothioation-dependent restriction protein DptH n=1 Tax=Sulfurimonas sp. C5 TaxID=3036947 RepID=UPI0024549760|nr:DNA phosphorothioation-dependent restriction protein DptH [Sulfurimonas sp. C5]MDH4943957.1 DNA phosphorothioation-dependent restriction protein DptH [Sulfurimonas sp. C5]
MSKQQFNNFLANKIYTWSTSNLKSGNRYGFYSDNKEQIKSLQEALSSLSNSTKNFELETNKLGTNSVALPYIDINGIKLVFVDDISMNPFYISNIRDSLSKNPDCALLILHKNRLDTLISAITDLSLPTYPLNLITIKSELQKLITEKTTHKAIFEYLLNYQSTMIEDDQQSVFGYEVLYNSIVNNKIDFPSFELFEDEELYSFDNGLLKADTDKIKQRIDKNDKLYREIKNTITNFPNELEDKLSDLSPKFIKDNIVKKDWQELSYNDISVEIDANKGQKILFDGFHCDDVHEIREDSLSAAGQRKKNIIVLTDTNKVTLTFKFDEATGIKSSNFTISHNQNFKKLYENKISCSGGIKKTATLEFDYDFKPLYFTVNFKGNKASENQIFKVLVLQKGMFYIDAIKNNFIVRPNRQEVLLQLGNNLKLKLNDKEIVKTIKLTNENEEIDVNEYDEVDLKHYYNNHDEVKLSISNGDNKLNLNVEGETETETIPIPFLFNKSKADHLFGSNKDMEFKQAKNKVVYENRERDLVAERLVYIKYEQKFIDEEIFASTTDDFSIEILKDINSNIYEAFKNLLDYFKKNKTTPSLCSWNDTVYTLTKTFVNHYLEYMQTAEENKSLNDFHKLLFEFGFFRIDHKKMASPFSPLILSYIVNLIENAKDSNSHYKDISEVTLSRLNPKGLFPYLFIDKENYAFTKVVKENSLWLEFVPNEKNEFSYVKKLTYEKIDEFTSSFKQLFEFRNDAPLIINSINNNTNKELFEGIVQFYKKSTLSYPIKIIVNLYDDEYCQTAFDTFADLDKYEDIKNEFSQFGNESDTLIDTIRTHLTYSKHLTSEKQNYSHLSFFKNNEKIEIKDNRTQDQNKSGLVANGLISGESSQKENGYYYSGFGLHNVQENNSSHIELAKIYNAMQRAVYEDGTNYESNKTISLMISEKFKDLLKKSYKNALWTVIIDPKVTLEFFDNEENLILIHYSDQYSSSANYDAITVTARKELYSNVIFSDNKLIDKESIVKQFNAFNGEWLIKMITEPEKDKKEKIGIITAYKYITSIVDTDDITWVPLSVAEMIRVSGNVGLSMDSSDFTRYNHNKNSEDAALHKGVISDDILLVGFKKDDVILYPVEVKASSADMQKACEQAISLKRFFYDHLFIGDSLKTRLLKGLFIRQVFMQIEKYELYDIFKDNYFEDMYKNREKLLDGTYNLIELENYSSGAVVAFLDKNQYDTQMHLKDEILEIRLPYQLQNLMIQDTYEEMKHKVQNGSYGTNKKYLLSNLSLDATLSEVEVETKYQHDSSSTDEFEEDRKLSNTEDSVQEIEKSSTSTQLIEILFGKDSLTEQNIFWHPTNTTENQNTCTGIIGRSGTGKTQFTKSLITQLVQQSKNNLDGKKIDILIFDYKKDYIKPDFVKATNAKVLDLEKLPINPLELFGDTPKLPTHTGRTLTTTLSKAFNLGNVQRNTLKNIIQDAYRAKGIDSSDKSTWSLPAPTLNDLWELYIESEDVKQDSLYAALDDLIDFEIFESDSSKTKSLYDVIDGVTVVNLSGYDSNIQDLVVAILLDLFYVQMHKNGSSKVNGDFIQITKMILVDEADNFMSKDFDNLKKILKEGREFGVGTILSTQELTHFRTSEDDYASYIFTWIVHKVANLKIQDIQSIFNINNKTDAEDLMSQIRELQKHYSFYVDGNKEITKIHDLAFFELLKGERK